MRSSYPTGPGYYAVEAPYAELLKSIGLPDGMSVFEHPKIEVWRSITERENCVLDHEAGRLHIKRNKKGFSGVDQEVHGIRLLRKAGIKTVPLVGAGMLNDRRGFLITDDLSQHDDSEKLVAGGFGFEKLLEPTAQLAARLHDAGLHHRDLYICHMYANVNVDPIDLVLMDAGRVKALPRFFRKRWVVKDLAQFIYSTLSLPVTDDQRTRWLDAYARNRKIAMTLRSAIDRKVRWIARHDAQLRRKDPTRNVAIDR